MAIVTLNGNDYIVFVNTVDATTAEPDEENYRPLMCIIDSSFAGSTDTIEVSNKCGSGSGWQGALPGVKSFTITGTAHAIDETLEPSAASYQEVAELWHAGQTFWAKIANKQDNQGTVYIREAVVFISDYTENQGLNEAMTFDFTLQGVGEPRLSTTS